MDLNFISIFFFLISWEGKKTDKQTCRDITVIVKENRVIEYNQILFSYVVRERERDKEEEEEKIFQRVNRKGRRQLYRHTHT